MHFQAVELELTAAQQVALGVAPGEFVEVAGHRGAVEVVGATSALAVEVAPLSQAVLNGMVGDRGVVVGPSSLRVLLGKLSRAAPARLRSALVIDLPPLPEAAVSRPGRPR